MSKSPAPKISGNSPALPKSTSHAISYFDCGAAFGPAPRANHPVDRHPPPNIGPVPPTPTAGGIPAADASACGRGRCRRRYTSEHYRVRPTRPVPDRPGGRAGGAGQGDSSRIADARLRHRSPAICRCRPAACPPPIKVSRPAGRPRLSADSDHLAGRAPAATERCRALSAGGAAPGSR